MAMNQNSYRGVSFRIKPSDDIQEELDRLARIISRKYNQQVGIILQERRRRH